MINNSWDVDGKSKNVADTVGLMVYEGAGVITLLHIFLFGFVQMTKWFSKCLGKFDSMLCNINVSM